MQMITTLLRDSEKLSQGITQFSQPKTDAINY